MFVLLYRRTQKSAPEQAHDFRASLGGCESQTIRVYEYIGRWSRISAVEQGLCWTTGRHRRLHLIACFHEPMYIELSAVFDSSASLSAAGGSRGVGPRQIEGRGWFVASRNNLLFSARLLLLFFFNASRISSSFPECVLVSACPLYVERK